MQRRTLLTAALATPFLRRPAYAATELVVHFPMPAFFKDVMDQVAAEFTRANPEPPHGMRSAPGSYATHRSILRPRENPKTSHLRNAAEIRVDSAADFRVLT
jgi:hypothetical protein